MEDKMKYSTVIFDLDGTLLDTSEGIMSCTRYTAEKLGIEQLTIEQQKSFIGPPIIDSFMRECGLSINKAKEAVEIYRQYYKEKGLFKAKNYNGIKELLLSIRRENCKTAVATLKRDDFAKEILAHFGLYDYFNVIKGIDEEDIHSKTDILLMCLKELEQEDLSKVLLIGDSVYDAIGAEQIGIDFICVTYGYGYKNKKEANESRNVFVAEKVDDIISFLNI
jgi:phosphoglycolate phosphatase